MASRDLERQALERLRGGDHAAFAALVRRESRRLQGLLRRLLSSEEDAKDCLQDVFLAAFRGLPDFNGDSSISTWLHRIAVNTALMRLRASRRRKECLVEGEDLEYGGRDSGFGRELLQWRPADPETALASRQTAAFVSRSLDRISDEHRSVIILRDFDDLDTAQAAAKLGTTPDAVKMRLHRARASLRQVLASSGAHVSKVRAPAAGPAQAEVAAA